MKKFIRSLKYNNTTFLLFLAFTLASACTAVQTQQVDSTTPHSGVLFSLKNGMDVYADEFEYAYQKNNFNNEEANTTKDIEEYLDLYVIFKQKVQAAQDLGMDTSKTFLDEFNGYKESLANSYINSKDLTEKLIQEAYDRYKEEVAASHILIKTNQEDTLAQYLKIDSIRQLAINGSDFSLLAKTYSEDPSAKSNAGDLGYFTSMRMVYPFESAAYNTPVGQVSEIVRTRFGYHVLYVRDRRPSQGKISVSHIMVRTNTKDTEEKKEIARNKIFEIQDQLNNGMNWSQLCKQFSEDQNTKNKSGKIAPFGPGQMPPTFSQAAFDLQKDGDYSDPILSPYGWHILKLDEKLPIESYKIMKPKIKNHISRDERVNITKKALVNKLKLENSFIATNDHLSFNKIDSTVLHGMWSYSSSQADTTLIFTIGDDKYGKSGFYQYVEDEQKPVRGKSLKSYTVQLHDKYVEASLIQYEKDHLADKNAEYRMLVKEYWEGILLFNLMNEMVWDKAVKDTIGLQSYFSRNRNQYSWDQRIKATVYNAATQEIINQIAPLNLNDTEAMNQKGLLAKFNNKSDLNLKIEERLYEKKDLDILNEVPWEIGKHEIAMDGRFYLVNIEEVIPTKLKELDECKGLVIADYQGELEQDWVKTLNKQYLPSINKPVWSKSLKKLEK